MLKRFCLILALCLSLTACNEADILIPDLRTVTIPAALFQDANCPQISKFPNYKNYTDKQVADLLVNLVVSNRKCKNTIDKIYQYLKDTNQIISK